MHRSLVSCSGPRLCSSSSRISVLARARPRRKQHQQARQQQRPLPLRPESDPQQQQQQQQQAQTQQAQQQQQSQAQQQPPPSSPPPRRQECQPQQQQQQQQQQAQQQPPQQPQPQPEPSHIRYNLSNSIGSYTDLPACQLPTSSSSSSSSHDGVSWPRDTACRTPGDCDAELIYGATVRFSDSAALRLRRRAMVVWDQGGPQRVLIVKKPVPAAAAVLQEMASWLEQRGLQVFVERSVLQDFPQYNLFEPATTQVDLAITLGGDGTVLHMASLFAEDVPLPPAMAFAMGTLGFLTPFDVKQYRLCLTRALASSPARPLYCTLRTRKRCEVVNRAGERLRVYHILNDTVIDRGASPSSVHLEIYVDGGFVTSAEADGLIIATPSGSTAYSMSAGGCMVAPSVPCTLLTPLSPHSLSFRPLIIPENADVLVRLPLSARSHARASFDGKHPMRIDRGTSIHFQTSLCPLPLINIGNLDSDWYEGITHKLKWNQRIRVPSAPTPAEQPAQQPHQPTEEQLIDAAAAAHDAARVQDWAKGVLPN